MDSSLTAKILEKILQGCDEIVMPVLNSSNDQLNCISESINVGANWPTTQPTICYDFGDNLMLPGNYLVDDRQMDASKSVYQRKFSAMHRHVSRKLILNVLGANRKTTTDKIKKICKKKFKSNELVRRDTVVRKIDDPYFALWTIR